MDKIVQYKDKGMSEAYDMALTEEIQDIISYRPHWIVRNGNVILFLAAGLFLCCSYFIRYPDKINSSARLIASNPPKQVQARTSGKLMRIMIQNEQLVSGGQHLAIIENNGNYDEIMSLNIWLGQIIQILNGQEIEALDTLSFHSFVNLGELQGPYQEMQDKLTGVRETYGNRYFDKKRSALRQDIHNWRKVRENTAAQEKMQLADRRLKEIEYQAYESLAKQKVIAPLELNEYKSRLLSQDRSLKQLSTQEVYNDISSHGKTTEILELDKNIQSIRQDFRSSVIRLRNEITKWIQQYVLITPESGQVLFISSLLPNQLVASGEPLFYVVPEYSSYYAEVVTGQKGFGKIKQGQTVILRIDGYPSDEFGYLTGRISYISSIPGRTDSFLLKANLVNGLTTSYGQALTFHNNLSARAEIITENKRLIQRLFGNFLGR